MKLAVLGVNFRTSPLALRERASRRPSEIPAVLHRIAGEVPGAGVVLVSTCNRTELYVGDADISRRQDALIRALVQNCATSEIPDVAPHFYLKTDLEAAEHLMAVAASLDSMVVGETEILGQVKQAYAAASREQTGGKLLHAVFQTALRCAKRVHSETDICRGRVSVSSLAVEFAEKIFEDLSLKTVMVVGAGETAELALKSLVDRGVREVLVLNRSLDRAEALARQHGGRAIQFELLDDYLPHTDIVISSTGAPHCVVRVGSVRSAVEARRGRPILLVDIAVPRDIEPGAADLKDVYLYHIDDLQRLADDNLAKRGEAVDAAWKIVREMTAETASLFEGDGVQHVLQRLDAQASEIREAALKRALAKEMLAALPESCHAEIGTLAHKIVNKMLAAPRAALRRAAQNGQGNRYAEVAADLFGLDKKDDAP